MLERTLGHPSVIACPLLMLVLALWGCDGDECAIGSARCACTTGGVCNPGLTCMSNRCVDPSSPPPDGGGPGPQGSIDLLLVIDNSNGMAEEQANLRHNFAALTKALNLGRGIDLRVGVVSSDLGAAAAPQGACLPNGDQGKLQSTARVKGCTAPTDPWISYSNGQSNVPAGSTDHLERVNEAFSCIADLGTDGCGFESTLQAARLALDPAVNPGFVRSAATLAVIFVTDEDDCSAKDQKLFEEEEQQLGPLTSFRCFQYGISCDINDPNTTGPRSDCKPAHDWLHSIDEYEQFYRSLKPAGKVVLAAIAGPASPVSVGKDGGDNAKLQSSCESASGPAVPAIRIKALVDRFGGLYSSICEDSFAPALTKIGQHLSGS